MMQARRSRTLSTLARLRQCVGGSTAVLLCITLGSAQAATPTFSLPVRSTPTLAPATPATAATAATPSLPVLPTGTMPFAPSMSTVVMPARPATITPPPALPTPTPTASSSAVAGTPTAVPTAAVSSTPVAASVTPVVPSVSASSVTATPLATVPAVAAPVVGTSPTPPAAVPTTSGSAPVFSAPLFTPQASTAAADEPAFEPGQVLVLWTTDEVASSGIATLQQRYQLRPRQRYTLASLGFTVVMLALPTDREAQALRTQLRAEQPDWVVDLNARSIPMQVSPPAPDAAPRLYAIQMLGGNLGSLANLKPLPPSLRLGVVDTGVDAALLQPGALNGSTVTLRSVLGPVDKPADTAHGSAVLQLMVGAAHSNGFAGSAPPVLIFWANAMRETAGKPSTNSLSLALALDWLVGQQVALINMSLGGQGDAVLKAVVGKVLAKNIAILAAVGNNPASNALPVYPAAYAGVWGITAVDAAGKLYAQANRASYATLAAPGVELWVPATSVGQASGSYVNGTSYASAMASAALAWQPDNFWAQSAEQRREQVCAAARRLEAGQHIGCGLVQKQ